MTAAPEIEKLKLELWQEFAKMRTDTWPVCEKPYSEEYAAIAWTLTTLHNRGLIKGEG